MARIVDFDDLVSTSDIAARLELRQGTTVDSWIRRYADFPKPLGRIGGARIWLWPDIEAWAVATGKEERLEKWRQDPRL